jgi:flagellar motor switch protein FliM
MEIKFPVALGQWHLYNPQNIYLEESISYKNKKINLSYLNKFSIWIDSLFLQAKDLYQLVINLKNISLKNISGEELPDFLNNNFIFEYSDNKGVFMFVLDEKFLNKLLNIYFGSNSQHNTNFSFSDMENLLVENFYKEFFQDYFIKTNFIESSFESFTHIAYLDVLKYIPLEQNFSFYDCKVNFSDGVDVSLKIFFPEHSLEKFQSRLKNNAFREINLSDKMKSGIKMQVPVKLSETTLTLGDFMNIQQGDVLLLNKKINEKIKYVLDDELSFLASVCKNNDKYSIILEDQIFKGVNDFDDESYDIGSNEDNLEEELLMNSFDQVDIQKEMNEEEDNNLDEKDDFDWETI